MGRGPTLDDTIVFPENGKLAMGNEAGNSLGGIAIVDRGSWEFEDDPVPGFDPGGTVNICRVLMIGILGRLAGTSGPSEGPDLNPP